MIAWLKSLTPRDLRGHIALVASIGGTIALTGVIVWLIYILWDGGWSLGTEGARIDKLGLIAVMVTTIMGVVMVSLGLAINRRSVKATGPLGTGFEASGGDDPVASAIQAAASGAAQGAVAATATQEPQS